MGYERHCCVIDCDKAADFEIWGDFNHPEDNTDACEGHVGALLGTPDWAIKMYGREARSWTVVPVTRTHFRPEEIWDIKPTGWHYEESGVPVLACYTLDCGSPYHADDADALVEAKV